MSTAPADHRNAEPGGSAEVTIRPIEAADATALRDFYAGLSDESRRTRFFGSTAGIGERQAAWFCTPDRVRREGFVAVIGGGEPARIGGGQPARIVGHVCVEPMSAHGDTAEIAIAVDDAFQGRGIGRRLADAAIAAARADGDVRLVATMLGSNPAIQRLLLDLGLPATSTPIGGGVVQATISLAPLARAA